MILRICFVAIVTAISAVILKINKPEYVPVCLTAGGVLLLVFAFDFEAAEDNRHDEDIIQRQAFFYQKSGIIEHSGFKAALINDKQTKD